MKTEASHEDRDSMRLMLILTQPTRESAGVCLGLDGNTPLLCTMDGEILPVRHGRVKCAEQLAAFDVHVVRRWAMLVRERLRRQCAVEDRIGLALVARAIARRLDLPVDVLFDPAGDGVHLVRPRRGVEISTHAHV